MTPETWALVLSGIAALAVVGVPFAIASFVLQRRTERRNLEARDVVWSATRFENDPNWYFEHSGTTPALDVKIDLTIEGRTSTERFNRVDPSSPVEVSHSWHSELIEFAEQDEARYRRERREYDAEPSDVEMPGALGSTFRMPNFARMQVPMPAMPNRVEAAFVVTWRSPLGVPDRQERTWTEEY